MVPTNQANRTTSGAVAIDRDDTHLRRPSLRLGGGLIDLLLAVLNVLFTTGVSMITVSSPLALAHSEEVEAQGVLIVGFAGLRLLVLLLATRGWSALLRPVLVGLIDPVTLLTGATPLALLMGSLRERDLPRGSGFTSLSFSSLEILECEKVQSLPFEQVA